MHKDDMPYLQMLAKQLGAKHFSASAMHRVVYPKRHAAWIAFDHDGMKTIMKRLVRDGMAIESTGPRGGAGWVLTPAGVDFGLEH
jgi:hypothetical protein